jgi:HAD superfamily hydrolase (TIGR01509 family)
LTAHDDIAARPRRPSAIVFDLDGTLADTREDIAAGCNHALVAMGRAPLPVSEIAKFVGDGGQSLVARAFGLSPEDPLVARALAAYNGYYVDHPANVGWMPGAREALDACAGIPLALATNKGRLTTLRVLRALDLESRFGTVVAGGDGPLKPDPAAIVAALAPLGVAAKDAWVVGDGPQDIGAGRAAGAYTIAVTGGFAREDVLRAALPDRVLASLHELPALLRRDE